MKKLLVFATILAMVLGGIINLNAISTVTDVNHNCFVQSANTPILDSLANTSVISRETLVLPTSVDLSSDNAFPCVRSQVGNSCVAWASTYYQFGYQVAAMNGWNAKNDESKQFSPKWTFNYLSNYTNGLSYDDVYEFLSMHGAVKYANFPTLPLESNPLELREWYIQTIGMEEALRYRVSEVQYLCYANNTINTPITSPNSESISIMKSYLNSGHVLTFSTNCRTLVFDQLSNQYDSSLNGQYIYTMLDNSVGGYAGHAMAIVGYDDNVQYDLDGDGVIQEYEKGAFKIVNSTGSDYMNEGFVWVMYDALNQESNADLDNTIVHDSFIDNYAYYVIEVAEYPLDLLAKVTLECSSKSSVKLDLGVSSILDSDYVDSCITLFNRHGERYNYSSTGKTPEEATFVFDFGNLCSYPVEWKKYYLHFLNASSTYPIIIKNIEFVDSTGKSIVLDNEDKTLLNASNTYCYLLAMVGDVNNDGVVNSSDATLIQQYLLKKVVFTDEQALLADVNGNNTVDINDSTYISLYLQGSIDVFPNGAYEYIAQNN